MMRGYATGGLVGGVAVALLLLLVSACMRRFRLQQAGDSGQQKGSGDALGKAYQQVINSSIKEGITREVRPGGIIWNATKQR